MLKKLLVTLVLVALSSVASAQEPQDIERSIAQLLSMLYKPINATDKYIWLYNNPRNTGENDLRVCSYDINDPSAYQKSVCKTIR